MGTRLFDQASISGADALDFIANILESSTEYSIESDIVALMTTDPLRVITDIDEQMVALTGSQRDELVGSPFRTTSQILHKLRKVRSSSAGGRSRPRTCCAGSPA